MSLPARLLSLAALSATATYAATIEPTPTEFLIPRATVRIDGDLDEWDLDTRGYSVDPSRAGEDSAISLHLCDPENPIQGTKDVSARVALAWDDTSLYIAGAVTDDCLRGIRPSTKHNVGPPGWKCDSVMLQCHSFRQAMKTNSPYSPSPNVNLRYEAPADGRGQLVDNSRGILDKADAYWKLPDGSKLASRETANGYVVEASIPWSAFEYRPQAGEVLFCSFLMGDIDDGEVLNQLGWHFDGEPRKRAVFRLLGRPESTGLMSLSSRQPQAGRRWSAHYRVDARTTDVRVEKLVLAGPDGETVSVPISVAVPKGQSTSDVIVVDEMPAKPGKYGVRLDAAVSGKTVALVTEAIEIRPGPPSAPLVRNPPGEVHHQRPDRVAHTAYEDHRRGILRNGFVQNRSGYERYILTHIKDYIDKGMEAALTRKDKWIAGKCVTAFTLYKLTGEQKYADWVRRGLEVAIELQKRKIDSHKLLTLTDARYHIWLHDPQTPLAPHGIEDDFQALWAQVASEPHEPWMFTEWGYHNRCWHRLGIQKIAMHFAEKLGKPVSPQLKAYVAWHDPVHDRFGYATDNSSGYHWVGLRYPVYWHQAFDTLDELAKHEGWVAALGRWRRYSSPSGALPNFGDTSGWCTGAGAALASYELMGRVTRDGRFRWQAHRIAEYLYNHFWPRHDQYHGPRDFVASGFCRAWLYADDAVAPVQPQRKSAVTFRTRCVATTPEEQLARPGLSRQKLTEEQVPDKLILTSGNDATRLWSMVELIDVGGHCGRIPGHIITLIQHDAALLAGQGYYERACDFNNIMWIEDMDGIAADPRPMRTEVPRLVEDPAVTYARIRVKRFQQMPVTYERDIVFVKNAFMLVKDRVTFHATMRVRIGPCWQTRDLGPQCGKDWFNAYYEYIYFTGLGLGRGVHAYRNPAWDLLVRFGPREGTQITALDRYEDNPYRPSPTQLRQSWEGIVQAGDVKTFTSVLLPHVPAFDVTKYADWIEILADSDETTLVKVRTEFDHLHHFQEVHWVLLQEDGAIAETDDVHSDARLAVVSFDRNRRRRPAVLVGGDVLLLEGEDLTKNARKPAAQSIYELPE